MAEDFTFIYQNQTSLLRQLVNQRCYVGLLDLTTSSWFHIAVSIIDQYLAEMNLLNLHTIRVKWRYTCVHTVGGKSMDGYSYTVHASGSQNIRFSVCTR